LKPISATRKAQWSTKTARCVTMRIRPACQIDHPRARSCVEMGRNRRSPTSSRLGVGCGSPTVGRACADRSLNVHFHVVVPDGVFTLPEAATRAEFRRLPTPDRMDLETLTVNVEMRVVAWLRRRGLLDDEQSEPPVELTTRSALDACLEGSLGLGELTALRRQETPLSNGHDAPPVPSTSKAASRTLSASRGATRHTESCRRCSFLPA
jgi:hypothetical protein